MITEVIVSGKADEKEGKSNFNASSFGLLVGLVAALHFCSLQ